MESSAKTKCLLTHKSSGKTVPPDPEIIKENRVTANARNPQRKLWTYSPRNCHQKQLRCWPRNHLWKLSYGWCMKSSAKTSASWPINHVRKQCHWGPRNHQWEPSDGWRIESSAKTKYLLSQKLSTKTASLLSKKSFVKTKLRVRNRILSENLVPSDLEINSENYVTCDPEIISQNWKMSCQWNPQPILSASWPINHLQTLCHWWPGNHQWKPSDGWGKESSANTKNLLYK